MKTELKYYKGRGARRGRGARQAVFAMTWQSSPSSGSTTSRMRRSPTSAWQAELRLSIS